MRRLMTLLALPIAFTLLSPPAEAKSDKSKVVKAALHQSVRIEVMVSGKLVAQASGVVVAGTASTSYILTNAHVVEPASESEEGSIVVLIERPRLLRVEARLVASGKVPDEDLALLAIDHKLPAAPIAAEEEVGVGDDVVVIGAPYGRSLSVSSGIVSQVETNDKGAQTAMKTDAPIGYGASGGGVFDVPSGKLVGLVEGYRTARVSFTGVRNEDLGFDVPMPGETFLAPPSKIRSFLRRAGLSRTAGLDLGGAGAVPALQRVAPPKATAQAGR